LYQQQQGSRATNHFWVSRILTEIEPIKPGMKRALDPIGLSNQGI
jgi:hypothetical protein